MPGQVVDASVVLAYLNREPTGLDLEAELFRAHLGAVNLAEIVSKLVETRRDPQMAQRLITTFQLVLHPADETLAIRAGALRVQTRHLGLSLGDRFCLALGERLGLPVLTADRAWAELGLALDIRIIR